MPNCQEIVQQKIVIKMPCYKILRNQRERLTKPSTKYGKPRNCNCIGNNIQEMQIEELTFAIVRELSTCPHIGQWRPSHLISILYIPITLSFLQYTIKKIYPYIQVDQSQVIMLGCLAMAETPKPKKWFQSQYSPNRCCGGLFKFHAQGCTLLFELDHEAEPRCIIPLRQRKQNPVATELQKSTTVAI